MKEKIEAVQKFLAVKASAKNRGMKISRAASKAGYDSVACKAFSIADQINFWSDSEGMVNAVRSCGKSCMSNKAHAYRYWAETTVNDVRVMAVAVYNSSRCLVRLDNMTFCQAYGEQSGELESGLQILGYTCDAESFSANLVIPKKITEKVLFEKPFQVKLPVEYIGEILRDGRWIQIRFQKADFSTNFYGDFLKSTGEKIFFLKSKQKTRAEMQEVLIDQPIPRPYHDGIREFL